MKLLILGMIPFLLGLSPIGNAYKEEQAIKNEFDNVYQNVQPKQFRVIVATPALTDIQDGEMVIFSSGAVKIYFRQNQDIYSVDASCITVRR